MVTCSLCIEKRAGSLHNNYWLLEYCCFSKVVHKLFRPIPGIYAVCPAQGRPSLPVTPRLDAGLIEEKHVGLVCVPELL